MVCNAHHATLFLDSSLFSLIVAQVYILNFLSVGPGWMLRGVGSFYSWFIVFTPGASRSWSIFTSVALDNFGLRYHNHHSFSLGRFTANGRHEVFSLNITMT